MKIFQFPYNGNQAVTIDPQFGTRIDRVVYLNKEEYKTETPFSFGKKKHEDGSRYQDKNFYIVIHGRNIGGGKDRLEKVVKELNEIPPERILNPAEFISERIPGLSIYASLEESHKGKAPKAIAESQKILRIIKKNNQ